jgi:hypothetical protein
MTGRVSLCVDMPEGGVASTVPEDLATVHMNYFAAASERCLFVGPDSYRGLDRVESKGEGKVDVESEADKEPGEEGKNGEGGEVLSKGRLANQKLDTPGAGVHVVA